MLKETQLADYFDEIITPGALRLFIASVLGENELKQYENVLNDLRNDRDVRASDLIKLCDDFASGEFKQSEITSIALFLEGSDHFMWDSSKPEGAMIAEILDDWSAPEVAYPINNKTIRAVRKCLIEGVYDNTLLAFVSKG